MLRRGIWLRFWLAHVVTHGFRPLRGPGTGRYQPPQPYPEASTAIRSPSGAPTAGNPPPQLPHSLLTPIYLKPPSWSPFWGLPALGLGWTTRDAPSPSCERGQSRSEKGGRQPSRGTIIAAFQLVPVRVYPLHGWFQHMPWRPACRIVPRPRR
jgi:hypothetical protein